VPDGAQSRIDVVSVNSYKSILSCLRPYEIVFQFEILNAAGWAQIASAWAGLNSAAAARIRACLEATIEQWTASLGAICNLHRFSRVAIMVWCQGPGNRQSIP
jgi:hypothetical protein